MSQNKAALTNKPKKHHYVSQFYLRGFLDSNSQLNIFDRYNKVFLKRTPGGIAYNENYYTVDTKQEKGSTILEETLGLVETKAKPVIDKLTQHGAVLTKEERENLGLFLALQQQRVPDSEKAKREMAEKTYKAVAQKFAHLLATNNEAFETTKKKVPKVKGSPELTQEDWLGLATGEKFKLEIEVPHSFVVKQMFDLALEVAPLICQMNWKVLYASKSRAFTTSDNPFILSGSPWAPGRGVGLITPRSRKFFPLTKGACLFMGDQPTATLEFASATSDGVRQINRLTALNSDRYIISHNQDLLKRIVKITKVDTFIKEERVQVG
ncbi:MAG: DUF4238 domain-containing protein [Candidatus Woykebacteria bacterium]